MQILRLRLSCAEKELELAKRTAQEELEPEDEPLVPLNKFNFDEFLGQEHKTRWMEALGGLLLASIV